MATLNEGILVCTIAVREGIGLFLRTVHYISRRSPLRTDFSEGSNVIWNATIQGCRGYVNRTDVWVGTLGYEGSPRIIPADWPAKRMSLVMPKESSAGHQNIGP